MGPNGIWYKGICCNATCWDINEWDTNGHSQSMGYKQEWIRWYGGFLLKHRQFRETNGLGVPHFSDTQIRRARGLSMTYRMSGWWEILRVRSELCEWFKTDDPPHQWRISIPNCWLFHPYPDGAQMGVDAEDPVSAEVVQSESAPWPQHPRCGQKCDAEAPSVRFPASVLYWKMDHL
jgi:hypothetical protein